MSIINDALRKAERLKQSKALSGVTMVEELPASVTRPVKQQASVYQLQQQLAQTQTLEPPFRVRFETAEKPKFNLSFPLFSKIFLITFLSCAIFVLLFGPWFYMWSGGRESSVQNVTVAAPPMMVERPMIALPAPPPRKATYKTYQRKDITPTVKPVRRLAPPQLVPIESLFKLTGISVLSDQDSIAIINGKVLETGDVVDGAEILVIEEHEVHLKKNNEEFILSLR